MANLPAVQDKETSKRERLMVAVADAMIKGHKPEAIGKVLSKGKDDRKTAKMIREWRRSNWKFQQIYAERAALASRQELAEGLVPASQALARRAGRGKPDAIKLLFEATGFHNPRVQHEHSGDIKITVDIPRPVKVEDEAGPVVDADVVDE